jgi:hypothetical protein
MNKLIFILVIALMSLHAFGMESGGVDVGNSNQKGKFGLPVFKTEAEMVTHLQALIPQIEKGELKEVQNLMKQGKCSSESAKFGELAVIPSYQYNKQTGKLEPEFSGQVSVLLNNCKRPIK